MNLLYSFMSLLCHSLESLILFLLNLRYFGDHVQFVCLREEEYQTFLAWRHSKIKGMTGPACD